MISIHFSKPRYLPKSDPTYPTYIVVPPFINWCQFYGINWTLQECLSHNNSRKPYCSETSPRNFQWSWTDFICHVILIEFAVCLQVVASLIRSVHHVIATGLETVSWLVFFPNTFGKHAKVFWMLSIQITSKLAIWYLNLFRVMVSGLWCNYLLKKLD